MKKIALGMALFAAAGLAQAQGFNEKDMYWGGGFSSNDMDGLSGSATGYQFFGGYQLKNVKLGKSKLKSAVEVGYMNSGTWDASGCMTFPIIGTQCTIPEQSAKGLWANYVATHEFSPTLRGIGRIGLDLGDDDGLMYGVGVGFKVDRQIDIRGEYVLRQNINSLQANLVYYMK